MASGMPGNPPSGAHIQYPAARGKSHGLENRQAVQDVTLSSNASMSFLEMTLMAAFHSS